MRSDELRKINTSNLPLTPFLVYSNTKSFGILLQLFSFYDKLQYSSNLLCWNNDIISFQNWWQIRQLKDFLDLDSILSFNSDPLTPFSRKHLSRAVASAAKAVKMVGRLPFNSRSRSNSYKQLKPQSLYLYHPHFLGYYSLFLESSFKVFTPYIPTIDLFVIEFFPAPGWAELSPTVSDPLPLEESSWLGDDLYQEDSQLFRRKSFLNLISTLTRRVRVQTYAEEFQYIPHPFATAVDGRDNYIQSLPIGLHQLSFLNNFDIRDVDNDSVGPMKSSFLELFYESYSMGHLSRDEFDYDPINSPMYWDHREDFLTFGGFEYFFWFNSFLRFPDTFSSHFKWTRFLDHQTFTKKIPLPSRLRAAVNIRRDSVTPTSRLTYRFVSKSMEPQFRYDLRLYSKGLHSDPNSGLFSDKILPNIFIQDPYSYLTQSKLSLNPVDPITEFIPIFWLKKMNYKPQPIPTDDNLHIDQYSPVSLLTNLLNFKLRLNLDSKHLGKTDNPSLHLYKNRAKLRSLKAKFKWDPLTRIFKGKLRPKSKSKSRFKRLRRSFLKGFSEYSLPWLTISTPLRHRLDCLIKARFMGNFVSYQKRLFRASQLETTTPCFKSNFDATTYLKLFVLKRALALYLQTSLVSLKSNHSSMAFSKRLFKSYYRSGVPHLYKRLSYFKSISIYRSLVPAIHPKVRYNSKLKAVLNYPFTYDSLVHKLRSRVGQLELLKLGKSWQRGSNRQIVTTLMESFLTKSFKLNFLLQQYVGGSISLSSTLRLNKNSIPIKTLSHRSLPFLKVLLRTLHITDVGTEIVRNTLLPTPSSSQTIHHPLVGDLFATLPQITNVSRLAQLTIHKSTSWGVDSYQPSLYRPQTDCRLKYFTTIFWRYFIYIRVLVQRKQLKQPKRRSIRSLQRSVKEVRKSFRRVPQRLVQPSHLLQVRHKSLTKMAVGGFDPFGVHSKFQKPWTNLHLNLIGTVRRRTFTKLSHLVKSLRFLRGSCFRTIFVSKNLLNRYFRRFLKSHLSWMVKDRDDLIEELGKGEIPRLNRKKLRRVLIAYDRRCARGDSRFWLNYLSMYVVSFMKSSILGDQGFLQLVRSTLLGQYHRRLSLLLKGDLKGRDIDPQILTNFFIYTDTNWELVYHNAQYNAHYKSSLTGVSQTSEYNFSNSLSTLTPPLNHFLLNSSLPIARLSICHLSSPQKVPYYASFLNRPQSFWRRWYSLSLKSPNLFVLPRRDYSCKSWSNKLISTSLFTHFLGQKYDWELTPNSKSYFERISLTSKYELPFVFSNVGFLFLSSSSDILLWGNEYHYDGSLMFARTNTYRYSFFHKNDLKRIYLRQPGLLKLASSFFEEDSLLENDFFLLNYLQTPRLGSKSTTKDSGPLNLANQHFHTSITKERSLDFLMPTIEVEEELDEPQIKRIRFKPGYQRVWRKARYAINYTLKYNCRYQVGLTKRLARIRRSRGKSKGFFRDLTLENILVYSQFVFDNPSSKQLLESESVYVNGRCTTNLLLYVVVGDFIQLAVHLRYYILYRWLVNWNDQHNLRFTKLLNYKNNNTSHTDLSKQVSRLLPDWVFSLGHRRIDIPNYLEVDFFTLSSFMIYPPLYFNDRNPLVHFDDRSGIHDMYNWKFIN